MMNDKIRQNSVEQLQNEVQSVNRRMKDLEAFFKEKFDKQEKQLS